MEKTTAHKIDRTTPATNKELYQKHKCLLCKKSVDLGLHMWVRVDGKISHDYCVRTRL